MKLPMNVNLQDKVVVITGAAGVICSHLAKAIAQSGAKVAILDRDLVKAQEVAAEIRKLQSEIKDIDAELKPFFDELGLDFPFDVEGK